MMTNMAMGVAVRRTQVVVASVMQFATKL